MATSAPLLTLAIPVGHSGDAAALRATLDSISRNCSGLSIDVLVQVGQADDSGFPPEVLDHSCSPQWAFELDEGIYPAMNRLLERATGQRILFLGAGDRVLSGLAAAIARWAGGDEGGQLELGSVRLPDAEPKVPRHYPARWDRSLLWRNTTHHQGIAYPTPLLRDLGGFPEEYRILADYAVNLRLWSAKVNANWQADEDWVTAAAGGVSRQFTLALYEEERRLKQSELPFGPARWVQPFWIGLKSKWKRAGQPG